MKTTRLITVIGLAAALSLGGCTINIGSDSMNHSDHMVSENSEFSAADLMFAQMMIPHHQQAVDLGELAATRAQSQEVIDLAEQIADEQAPEIELMKSWLEAAGASEHMDHNMGMDGMLSDAEMQTLENSSGAEFDRLFLEGMIAHHEGAIAMAQDVVDSKNAEVAGLAAAIIKSQTTQIEYMRSLLGS